MNGTLRRWVFLSRACPYTSWGIWTKSYHESEVVSSDLYWMKRANEHRQLIEGERPGLVDTREYAPLTLFCRTCGAWRSLWEFYKDLLSQSLFRIPIAVALRLVDSARCLMPAYISSLF